MHVDDIQVGQTLQGKGADCDKTRLVKSINATKKTAVTQVYRNGEDLGESTIDLRLLAQWAAGIVPQEVKA